MSGSTSIGALNVLAPSAVINSRRQSITSDPTIIHYPSDIGPHYLLFNIKRWDRFPGVNSKEPSSKIISSFALPLPMNFGEAMSTDFSKDSMSLAGVATQAGYDLSTSKGIEGAYSFVKNSGAFNPSDILSAAAVKATNGKHNLGLGIGQTIGSLTGTIINPDRTMIFGGVPLREHTWQWVFGPESSEESDTLGDIIQLIKTYMLPNATNLNTTLEYPCMFDISLAGQSVKSHYQYQFKSAVCVNINVDRGYQGKQAFFRGTGAPVTIPMSVSFVELESFTRKDINPNTTSDSTLAGTQSTQLLHLVTPTTTSVRNYVSGLF